VGNVRYIGVNSLEVFEREIMKKLVMDYMVKLNRILHNPNARFHVKLLRVNGKMMYSFSVRLKIGKEFMSFNVEDWDMRRTVRKVMTKVLNAVEKELKIKGQKQQKFHPKKAKRGFGKYVKMMKGLVSRR
jgi:hypothetical protein